MAELDAKEALTLYLQPVAGGDTFALPVTQAERRESWDLHQPVIVTIWHDDPALPPGFPYHAWLVTDEDTARDWVQKKKDAQLYTWTVVAELEVNGAFMTRFRLGMLWEGREGVRDVERR